MRKRSEDERNGRGLALMAVAVAVALVFAQLTHRMHTARIPPDGPLFASAPRAPEGAKLSATLEPGKVTLDGEVRSEAERATLVASTRGAFPASDVEDHLRIVPTAEGSTVFRAVLVEARAVRWGILFLDAAGLTARGDVREGTDVRELERTMRAVASGRLTIDLAARQAPLVDPNVLEAALRVLFVGPLEVGWRRTDLDPNARAVVEALLPTVGKLEGLVLTIEVVPNSKEPAPEWQDLALARAEAIRKTLTDRGAPADHVRAKAVHLAPVAPRPTAAKDPARVEVEVRFSVHELRPPR